MRTIAVLAPSQTGQFHGSVGQILAISFGVVCAIIAIGLWFFSRSRWGQNKPLTNCIVLAVLAHVWLLMYAYGTRVVTIGTPGHGGSHGAGAIESIEWMDVPTEPFDSMPETASDALTPPPLVVTPPPLLAIESSLVSNTDDIQQDPTKQLDNLEHDALDKSLNEEQTKPDALSPELIEELLPSKKDIASPSIPNPPSDDVQIAGNPFKQQDIPSDLELTTGKSMSSNQGQGIEEQPILPEQRLEASQTATDQAFVVNRDTNSNGQPPIPATQAKRQIDQQSIPESYQLRFSTSRLAAAQQFGGDASTEAAVEAGLRWLAENQEIDGSWNAAKHGGGRETQTMERDRAGTGAKADTAMTGLSILAFLGAGYTQSEGTYAATVASGLEFLLRSQMPSGDLAGLKQIGNTSDVYYARMYSHGMAALAIAEAYAMTGDRRLVEPIQRAIIYTLQAQNRRTGGWRYQAFSVDDPGDTSQFGWQAMALLSSQNGGFTLPMDTIPRMHSYLNRVSVGRDGGLAVYRPLPGQQPTPAMTAEALAMRFMLKQPTSPEAVGEAKQYLLKLLPGQGEENLYYWYYASLALFQLQDESWPIWNEAMKSHLLRSQVLQGNTTGSWDPRCIWAGYGGRVYSTSMSCLCLEVYYRYLPIYRTHSFASSSQSELKR